MYSQNEPAIKKNEAVLNDFSGELYAREANGKIPDNCKYVMALIQAVQNQNQNKHKRFSKCT